MSGRKACVVTGGRGFAARHLVLQLLRSEQWTVVRILDLAPHVSLEPHEQSGLLAQFLSSGKAVYVSVDLRNASQVLEACRGADAVFHMAAPDSSINNFNLHYTVTVQGTRNVVNACISNNVGKLIYTSSPSVVFDGIHGIITGDESLPYPEQHNDIYSETKAQAEAIVLAANGKLGLVTCALRPSSIFGPGDRLLVPSVTAAARSGKMKFILGDGKNMYDFTYVENVAHAHLCAEKSLDTNKVHGDGAAAGKAYFITNKEPIAFWEFMSELLEGLGYERPKIHLPIKLLMPIGYLVSWLYDRAPSLFGGKTPQFTPSRLRLVSSWRTFSCERAARLIGYEPIVPLKDGIRRTVESFYHLRAEPRCIKSRDLNGVSKLHKAFGAGLVSDLLLWRDAWKTSLFGIAVSAMLYYFLISSVTVLSGVSKLLLVLTVIAFFQRFLPASVFGSQRKVLAAFSFEISDHNMKSAAKWLRTTWNGTWNTWEEAVHKRSFVSLGKLLLFGCIMRLLGRYALRTVILAGWALALIVFYVYDRYESEVDDLVGSVKEFLVRRHGIFKDQLSSFRHERNIKNEVH